MINRPSKKKNIHQGQKVRRIRTYLGLKQQVLATDLGVSQSEISKIENQDKIEERILSRIADVLGVPSDIIKDFDEEKIIYNINSCKPTTSSSKTATVEYTEFQQINPVKKIIELYLRLLESEREKIELLKNK